MFSRLLLTARRPISASYNKIVKCPVKGGNKLTTSTLGVFQKQNYKKAADRSKKPLKILATLRQQFTTLSQSQLAQYSAIARANARKAAARRAVFKHTRMTGYVLFVQRNYAAVASTILAEPGKKAPLVAKVLSKQWKAQGNLGRAKYTYEAQKIRSAAIQQRDKMITKYSK
ncbi:hypothetical protein XU18_5064 [Perkinsela sp. CCAP 1560/4]|nr:hypothetical protein XU18_5064 [Perkinsela sp. CCAP 1560/4]|eukprot:KNH02442.1 hypothetical protein XU18_5064 [Perkinsela sp. CCAP 1560/4]